MCASCAAALAAYVVIDLYVWHYYLLLTYLLLTFGTGRSSQHKQEQSGLLTHMIIQLGFLPLFYCVCQLRCCSCCLCFDGLARRVIGEPSKHKQQHSASRPLTHVFTCKVGSYPNVCAAANVAYVVTSRRSCMTGEPSPHKQEQSRLCTCLYAVFIFLCGMPSAVCVFCRCL